MNRELSIRVLDRPEEYRKMAEVESDLWWYRALHHLVTATLGAHPQGREARIVDAGCGTGGLLLFLRQHGYRHLRGFDLAEEALTMCRRRALAVEQCDLRQLDQVIPAGSADAVISNDTLYFFTPAEQQQIVRLCWQALSPAGWLILNLPALSAFRGPHDLSVGIQRRFSRADLPPLLPPSQFRVVRTCFWPFCLSPVIYAVRLSRRLKHHAEPQKARSDLHLSPPALNRTLEWLVRLENAVLPWKPFGSSLFVVAVKVDASRDGC